MTFARPIRSALRTRVRPFARAASGASAVTLAFCAWSSPAHAQAACVGVLGASGAQAAAAGATATVGLTIGAGCVWAAQSNAPWITSVTATGTGSGAVSYTVAPNDGATRVGTFTAAGVVFAVTQAPGCAVTLITDHGAADANGGLASFNATTGAGCDLRATTAESWIHNLATAGSSVTFTVDASGGGAGRTGTIVVTAPSTGESASYTLTQSAGCAIMLPVSAASAPIDGGTGTLAVNSGPGCTWSAAPSDSWLTGVTPTPSGVTYVASRNTGPARSGNVVVSSLQTASTGYFQVNQPSGCFVALPASTVGVSAAGGTANFAVTFGASCAFSVSSSTSWLTGVQVTASGAQFTAAANAGVARTGAITVLSSDGSSMAVLTVDQAGTLAAPQVTTQPVAPPAPVAVGTAVTFDVTATGGGLSYQWTRNGVNVSGATAASFTIASVGVGDAGAYAVVITNSAGNVTSDTVTLAVIGADGDAGVADGGSEAGSDSGADAAALGDGGDGGEVSSDGGASVDATVTADAGGTVRIDPGTGATPGADGGTPGEIGGGSGGCSAAEGHGGGAAGDFALMGLGVVALGATRKKRRG